MVAGGAHPDQQIRDDCAAIWQALAPIAAQAQTIGYHALADALGIRRGLMVNPERLGRIHRYCTRNGLTPLNALVINVRKGRPGNYYFDLRRGDGQHGSEPEIIARDWAGVQAHTPEYAVNPGPAAFDP